MAEVRSRSELLAAAVCAREVAQSLRTESRARREEVRRGHRLTAHRKRHTATVLEWLEETRAMRYRSAWSDLPWQWPDAELDHVLVALDRET